MPTLMQPFMTILQVKQQLRMIDLVWKKQPSNEVTKSAISYFSLFCSNITNIEYDNLTFRWNQGFQRLHLYAQQLLSQCNDVCSGHGDNWSEEFMWTMWGEDSVYLFTLWGKKTAPFYFCHKFVKPSYILIIFGTHIPW